MTTLSPREAFKITTKCYCLYICIDKWGIIGLVKAKLLEGCFFSLPFLLKFAFAFSWCVCFIRKIEFVWMIPSWLEAKLILSPETLQPLVKEFVFIVLSCCGLRLFECWNKSHCFDLCRLLLHYLPFWNKVNHIKIRTVNIQIHLQH